MLSLDYPRRKVSKRKEQQKGDKPCLTLVKNSFLLRL